MRFQGAFLREQGVEFGVVIVKETVLHDGSRASAMIQEFRSLFSNSPVVLMAQDPRGTPTYYGRKDIVEFLARVPLRAIPWREYTVN